jgi:hypothetical protein
MYQSISVQFAQARHSDMVAVAQQSRRALEARTTASAGQSPARRRSRPWQPARQLRPQVQS